MTNTGEEKPLVVMISSTARDLPEYRQVAMDVCLRLGKFPKMMEHLPALDADATKASMDMVEEAHIYLCILAHRYGSIPDGEDKSYTELEYDRAAERGIPRLVFFMDPEHPFPPSRVETGPGAEKLKQLKERVGRVAASFTTPDKFRALLTQSLVELQKEIEGDKAVDAIEAARSLHPSVGIPAAPEPYIAHQFSLLRTRTGLIGRRDELNLLTDWITGAERLAHARVMALVAIGGQGKSALCWHWFKNVAPKELTGPRAVEGSIWWSFYESDATYENFVIRATAYVTGVSPDEVRKRPLSECEYELLAELDQRALPASAQCRSGLPSPNQHPAVPGRVGRARRSADPRRMPRRSAGP